MSVINFGHISGRIKPVCSSSAHLYCHPADSESGLGDGVGEWGGGGEGWGGGDDGSLGLVRGGEMLQGKEAARCNGKGREERGMSVSLGNVANRRQ